MRIEIVNRTDFDERDLRRFLRAGFEAEDVKGALDWQGRPIKAAWVKYRVEFYPPGWRGRRKAGYGHYHRRSMELMLSPSLVHEDAEERAKAVRRLAQVFVHELQHNRGERHKDMVWSTEIDVPWADGLEIRRKAPKEKRRRDLRAEREAHARGKLAEHAAKLRREQKLVKKWRAKVHYYERTREKLAALKEERDA